MSRPTPPIESDITGDSMRSEQTVGRVLATCAGITNRIVDSCAVSTDSPLQRGVSVRYLKRPDAPSSRCNSILEEAAADADLAIVVIDASREMLQEDRDLLARLAPSGKVLVAANKVDLPSAVSRHALQSELDNFVPRDRVLFVSAQSGEAVAELRQRIVLAAAPALGGSHESALLTNLRQQLAVESATASLHSARRAAECNTPHEMLLLDLYASLQSLDELTGATTNDDILGRIFSTFCVGK